MIAKKIAGRGEVGNLNWGADFTRSKKTLNKELQALRQHIGEKVLLTGWGGGNVRRVTLKDAWIEPYDDKKWALVARLSPSPFTWMDEDFTPYLDSWQISIIEK